MRLYPGRHDFSASRNAEASSYGIRTPEQSWLYASFPLKTPFLRRTENSGEKRCILPKTHAITDCSRSRPRIALWASEYKLHVDERHTCQAGFL